MSTGDQSQYVRSKLAERGSTRGAKFMKDGFDTWAESEAPAREGQMSKVPSEIMEDNYGGAMTVRHAKKMLHGGSALSDAVDAAKKILNFWRSASQFIDDFDEELEYTIIRGTRPSPGLKKFARDLRDVIAGIRTSKSMLDGVASLAGTVGLGKNQMRGGMTVQEAGQYVSEIMKWFRFLFQAYNNVMAILEMESFKYIAPQIKNAFDMIKGAVGLGRSGGALSMSGEPAGSEPLSRKVGGRRVGSGLVDDMMAQQKMHAKQAHQYQQAEMEQRLAMERSDAERKQAMGGRRRGGVMPSVAEMHKIRLPTEVTSAALKLARSQGGRRGGSVPGLDPEYDGISVPGLDYDPRFETVGLGRRRGGFMPSVYDLYPVTSKEAKQQSAISMMGQQVARAQDKVAKGGRSCGGRAPSARGAIVKKVMQEHGLSLPQASKYVKEHGLY